MNVPKYEQLAKVPVGVYSLDTAATKRPWWKFWEEERSLGYLTVTRSGGRTRILFTSHIDHHQRHYVLGCAKCLYIDEKGNINYYLEGAINMHVINKNSKKAMEFADYANYRLCVERNAKLVKHIMEK